MGDSFRLVGLDPKTEGGQYFDDTRWWWHALWDYTYSICRDILTQDDYINGHRLEDGFMLTEEQAVKISDRLMDSIESGECDKYEQEQTKAIESIPLEKDNKQDSDSRIEGLMYPFTTDNVRAFAEFCYNSGGFVIVNRES